MAYQAPNFIHPQDVLEFQGVNGNYSSGVFHGLEATNMFARNVNVPSNISAPLANYNIVDDSTRYLDSGATNHVT